MLNENAPLKYHIDRFGNRFRDPYASSSRVRPRADDCIKELWEDVCADEPAGDKLQELNAENFEKIDAINEDDGRRAAGRARPAVQGARQLSRHQGVIKKRLKLRKGITVDSGAANNVMPRRMIRDRSKIRPSPGSRRGAHFVAANDGRIPNEGEIDFAFKTTEGHERIFVFQVAETNKPLGAASYFVDEGFRVVFDKDMKTGVDLSMMLNKATGEVTRFRRDRNIWVMDAIIEDEIPHECHFHRHA